MAQDLVDRRRERMSSLLRDRSYLPVSELCRRFQISQATARRDLSELSRQKQVVRTFGGAMADYDRRFAPFAARLKIAARAKARIAAAAVELIKPGSTVFLDAGTTLFAVSGALRRRAAGQGFPSIRVVTNSMAVAESLATARGVTVDLLGGRMLPNQSVLLGNETCKAAAFYQFDWAFLGAEGFDAAGIWNSGQEVVEIQQAVLERSRHHALLLDGGKLGLGAPALLMTWEQADVLITDADLDKIATVSDLIPGKVRTV
ncbi:MAG: DeoR/GlpR family DNA-binding transcription regulator [Planctomycetota bacterium]|nr:DeoR/GlpR family DNA-binding transcription regulator [Planctomycetota bacterium]